MADTHRRRPGRPRKHPIHPKPNTGGDAQTPDVDNETTVQVATKASDTGNEVTAESATARNVEAGSTNDGPGVEVI